MANDFVSIIIPNFNHALFLEQRISSVLNQTYENIEVLILDDCSSDDSKSIILKYKNHPKVNHIVFNVQNSGSTFEQWKLGLSLAKGNLIWIAESDDFCDVEFLSEMVRGFKDEKVGLAYCRTNQIIESDNAGVYMWGEVEESIDWSTDFQMNGLVFIQKCMRYRNAIPNASAVVFRKSSFNLKALDLSFRYCNDWLCWVNILKVSDVYYLSKNLNYFRLHAHTTRSIKPFKAELKRLAEYAKVIYRINSMFTIVTFKISHLNWIKIEIKEKTSLYLNIYFNLFKNKCKTMVGISS